MNGFMVRTSDGEKHSFWHTEKEADHQIDVLKDKGFTGCYTEELDANYENGQYFV